MCHQGRPDHSRIDKCVTDSSKISISTNNNVWRHNHRERHRGISNRNRGNVPDCRPAIASHRLIYSQQIKNRVSCFLLVCSKTNCQRSKIAILLLKISSVMITGRTRVKNIFPSYAVRVYFGIAVNATTQTCSQLGPKARLCSTPSLSSHVDTDIHHPEWSSKKSRRS